MQILRPDPVSGLLPWPDAWKSRRYNACNEPCDMLIGPCACGGWHFADENWVRYYLNHYGATIQITPQQNCRVYPIDCGGPKNDRDCLGNTVPIILSRHNLLGLLARLEAGEQQPLLFKRDGSVIGAESDTDHYKDCDPNVYDPEITRIIREYESLLALRNFLKGTP